MKNGGEWDVPLKIKIKNVPCVSVRGGLQNKPDVRRMFQKGLRRNHRTEAGGKSCGLKWPQDIGFKKWQHVKFTF